MKSGDMFWAKSEGIAEEERGRHPWIVLSSDEVTRHGGLVIAVPVTSNPTRYKTWDVYVDATEIALATDVRYPLDPDKLGGVVKCAKLRHWSVARVDEVIGRASRFFVGKLRLVVAHALELRREHRGSASRSAIAKA